MWIDLLSISVLFLTPSTHICVIKLLIFLCFKIKSITPKYVCDDFNDCPESEIVWKLLYSTIANVQSFHVQ